MRKGSYLLVLFLERSEDVEVGRLGVLRFPAGLYLYCGSALGGVEARVGRHLRREKRPHWHIDHLSAKAETVGALIFLGEESLECRMAALLDSRVGLNPVPKFGCSDCCCYSHLFHLADEEMLESVLDELERNLR